MLGRGIRRRRAQRLMVLGFLGEVIERLGDEKSGDELRGLMRRKFAAGWEQMAGLAGLT